MTEFELKINGQVQKVNVGVGEVAIPTVAPELCNALASAGYRPHSLPIKNDGFVWI